MLKIWHFFGLKLGYLLFDTVEGVSETLQAKDTSLQEALSTVNLAKSFYLRMRNTEAFNSFFDTVVKSASDLGIGKPKLPKNRQAPAKLDSDSF